MLVATCCYTAFTTLVLILVILHSECEAWRCPMEDSKPEPTRYFLLSKQIIIAAVTVVAGLLQAKYGFVCDPSMQLIMVGVLMAILREVSKGRIRFTKEKIPVPPVTQEVPAIPPEKAPDKE